MNQYHLIPTQPSKCQIDPQLEKLENAIKRQKMEMDQTTPTFSWHDIHHYTAVYVIMAIILIIGIIWIIKKYKVRMFYPEKRNVETNLVNAEPIALPRSQRINIEEISFP